MLELLATVDPMAALMGGLWLFAAGMFPVGFMMGSWCSPCCSGPPTVCGGARPEDVPDTVTVQISEWADSATVRGPDLALLEFVSTFGSGAAGKVTAPTGNPGPLSGVELTSGGSGYAVLARACPTVSATAATGTGAAFSVNSSVDYDAIGLPFWKVDSISVTNAGSGYLNGAQVSFSFSPSSAIVLGAPAATIKTGRAKPTLSASCYSLTGSGAVLSVPPDNVAATTDWNGETAYAVTSIAIASPGAGYEVWDEVYIATAPGTTTLDYAYGMVSAVDSAGGITAITLYGGGLFYADTGVISSVSVDDPGSFYAEDPSASAISSPITVNVLQQGTTVASGAILQAVVDTNTASPSFGSIVSVSVLYGGTGYLAWDSNQITECCSWFWSGKSAVLTRYGASPCSFFGLSDGPTCSNPLWLLSYNYSSALGSTLSINYQGIGGCSKELVALPADQPSGKIEFPFVMTGPGVVATVSAGGTPPETIAPGNRYPCCRGGSSPSEITITLEPPEPQEGDEPQEPTDIVLTRDSSATGYCDYRWCSSPGCIGDNWIVSIEQCGNYFAGTASCPSKCETRIMFSTPAPGGVNDGPFSEPDKKCQSSTMCSPEPGVYYLTRWGKRFTETVRTPGTSNVRYVRGLPYGPVKVTIQ